MTKLLSSPITMMIFVLLGLSIWYVGSRLHTLFGLQSRWPIQIAVTAAVIGAMAATIAAVKSSSPIVGKRNILGGCIFTFYIFLLLALLCIHAVQMVRPLPSAWSGIAALSISLAITAAGALWANSFAVNTAEIQLVGLDYMNADHETFDMHLSDDPRTIKSVLPELVLNLVLCDPGV